MSAFNTIPYLPIPIHDIGIIPWLSYNKDSNSIFCNLCRSAVWFNALKGHLADIHRLPPLHRRPAINHFKSMRMAQVRADIKPRSDDSPVLPYLPTYPGYACLHCNTNLIAMTSMSIHISKVHDIHNQHKTHCRPVMLQTWYNQPGRLCNFWIVNTTTPQPTLHDSTPSPADQMLKDMLEEDEEMLVEELNADHYIHTEGYTWYDTNMWLTRMRWQDVFDGQPTDLIINTYSLPYKIPTLYHIGSYDGQDIISPQSHEIRIIRILNAFKQLINRCLETLDNTPTQIRCWWYSFHRGRPHNHPFKKLQMQESITRYINLWCNMLCYLFRLFNMDEEHRDVIYGLQLDQDELDMMQDIWNSTSTLTSPNSRYHEYDPVADYYANCPTARQPPSRETEELLFGLCIKMLTQHFDNGEPEQNIIIHFSNVYGLRKGGRCFRTPKAYTPYIAPLIYIGRLLLLEYALPIQSYTYLDLPARDDYESRVERMHEVRDPYLIHGEFYPIAELLERMKLGRVIAREVGAKPILEWSPDRTVLRCMDEQVSMSDFKGWVKHCIADAEEQLSELMFGFEPDIDLSKVADTMSVDKRGYYFPLHPKNAEQGMAGAYKELVRRCGVAGPCQMYEDGKWLPGSIDNYLKKRNAFLQRIMLCMHLSGGLPARGPEIATTKYRNSDTLRNIIFYQGCMAYLAQYHKAKASNNFELYTARFLPDSVGRLLFSYLVYVRPFSSSLLRQTTNQHAVEQHLLFCTANSPQTPWKSDMLFKILKSSSKQYLPDIKFGIANYRQVVVGIADEYLKNEVKKFDLRSIFHDPVQTAIAWQTSHSLAIRQGNYGAQKGYPINLQPRLLDQYLQISQAWHHWLGVASSDTIQHTNNTPLYQTPKPTRMLSSISANACHSKDLTAIEQG